MPRLPRRETCAFCHVVFLVDQSYLDARPEIGLVCMRCVADAVIRSWERLQQDLLLHRWAEGTEQNLPLGWMYDA